MVREFQNVAKIKFKKMCKRRGDYFRDNLPSHRTVSSYCDPSESDFQQIQINFKENRYGIKGLIIAP